MQGDSTGSRELVLLLLDAAAARLLGSGKLTQERVFQCVVGYKEEDHYTHHEHQD